MCHGLSVQCGVCVSVCVCGLWVHVRVDIDRVGALSQSVHVDSLITGA